MPEQHIIDAARVARYVMERHPLALVVGRCALLTVRDIVLRRPTEQQKSERFWREVVASQRRESS